MHAPAPPERRDLAGFSPRMLVYFAIVTIIWGSTWLVIRTQLGIVPTSWSVAYRFILGSMVLILVCRVTGKSLRLPARGHGFAMGVAILQFALNFNLVYRAEEHVTSGLVALSFALLVVPNAVLAALFLGQPISRGFAIGSAIGIAGVGLLFARDIAAPGNQSGELLWGLLLALGGVLCASIANVMQASPAGRALPIEAGLAWSMAYGGLLNVAIAWWLAGPPVFDASSSYVLGLAYLGIIASAVAFSLYFALIRAVGPGKAAYTGVVIPIVAMALSTVFEGYVWSGMAVAGAAIAMAGLVVALRSRG